MSESSGLTGRYAKALYQLAEEKKLVSKIVKDFQDIKALLENNKNEDWSITNFFILKKYMNNLDKI